MIPRRRVLGAAAAALAVCAAAGVGPAGADPADPAVPGTALTADHYGVVAGSPDAPVQLELFCDPQCPECAKFEAADGAALQRGLADGRVALTYRWMTFLDARRHNDVSARLGNALIAAADPATPAPAYQAFVAALYRAGGDPAPTEIADTARAAGLPEPVVDRIGAAAPAVDPTSLNAFNRVQLLAVNPEHPGTPTVYDRVGHTLVDTGDPGWLDRLLAG